MNRSGWKRLLTMTMLLLAAGELSAYAEPMMNVSGRADPRTFLERCILDTDSVVPMSSPEMAWQGTHPFAMAPAQVDRNHSTQLMHAGMLSLPMEEVGDPSATGGRSSGLLTLLFMGGVFIGASNFIRMHARKQPRHLTDQGPARDGAPYARSLST